MRKKIANSLTSGDVAVLLPFGSEIVDSFSVKISDENEFDPLDVVP